MVEKEMDSHIKYVPYLVSMYWFNIAVIEKSDQLGGPFNLTKVYMTKVTLWLWGIKGIIQFDATDTSRGLIPHIGTVRPP